MNTNDITLTLSIQEYHELRAMLVDIRDKVARLTAAAESELLTPKEVCELLKVSRDTYQRHVKQGILTQVAVGKGKRVRRSEINRLLAEGKV